MSWLSRHFYIPSSQIPLAGLRFGLASVLIFQAVSIAPDFLQFYGSRAILQEPISAHLADIIPSATEVASIISRWGIGEVDTLLIGMGILYVISLSGLLLGIMPRLFAAFAWLLHMILARNHSTAYGADTYAHFGLFYLAVFRSSWSLIRKTEFTLGLRLLQWHLAISYLASGIEKSKGPQWWNGEVIWRALQLPVYQQVDFSWLSEVAFILPVLSVGTLFLEMAYPVLMAWQRSRVFCLISIVTLHAGIATFLGLKIFGWVMIVFNVALFSRIPLRAYVVAKKSIRKFSARDFAETKLIPRKIFVH